LSFKVHGKGNGEVESRYDAKVTASTNDDCPQPGDHDTGLSCIAGDIGILLVASLECGPARSLDIRVDLGISKDDLCAVPSRIIK
jgi:hypothetical protein